jgi:peptide/nickel transport system permease protein
VLGYSRRSIVVGEILPNLSTPLLVEYGLRVTWSIAVIAAASFLGLGVQAPAADWGLMINENRDGLVTQPWGVIAPVVMIALFTIGSNLIADGVGRAVAGDELTGGRR